MASEDLQLNKKNLPESLSSPFTKAAHTFYHHLSHGTTYYLSTDAVMKIAQLLDNTYAAYMHHCCRVYTRANQRSQR